MNSFWLSCKRDRVWSFECGTIGKKIYNIMLRLDARAKRMGWTSDENMPWRWLCERIVQRTWQRQGRPQVRKRLVGRFFMLQFSLTMTDPIDWSQENKTELMWYALKANLLKLYTLINLTTKILKLNRKCKTKRTRIENCYNCWRFKYHCT